MKWLVEKDNTHYNYEDIKNNSMTDSSKTPVLIGIIGYNELGKGVSKVLHEREKEISEKLGFPVKIDKITHDEIHHENFDESPHHVTTNHDSIINDPEISIVVELLGDMEESKEVIEKSLKKGIHVITANRELLAKHGNELFDLAKKSGTSILFEAAIGGIIPCVKILRENYSPGRIRRISGILNGACNFILTKMHEDHTVSFSDAVREAQRLKYIESLSAIDIDGHDSAHKLAILSALAFNTSINYREVKIQGISHVTQDDIQHAEANDCVLRLIAKAEKNADGSIAISVGVKEEKKTSFFGSVTGRTNAILIEDDLTGPLTLTGAGEGKLPEAMSIVADIMEAARDRS